MGHAMDDQPSIAPSLEIEPTPEEGLELMKVFFSIPSKARRLRLLQIAKSYVRLLEKNRPSSGCGP
jgi:hypothetical protein